MPNYNVDYIFLYFSICKDLTNTILLVNYAAHEEIYKSRMVTNIGKKLFCNSKPNLQNSRLFYFKLLKKFTNHSFKKNKLAEWLSTNTMKRSAYIHTHIPQAPSQNPIFDFSNCSKSTLAPIGSKVTSMCY